MSRVARKGTFAEVEYTHLYAHLRLAFKIRVKSRITSHNRHDLDSQRKRELDPPEAVSVTSEMTFRPQVVSGCVRWPSLPRPEGYRPRVASPSSRSPVRRPAE